jgi:drug/metabolite transporter (DMT)-like permease
MHNSVLYFLTVLIWGTTWIAINYQLGDVAPEASIFYRFALATFILFSYARLKKLPLRFSLKHHLYFLLFGMCLFGFNYVLLYHAQGMINSALACIAFSTLMLMNLVNAKIFYQTKITKQAYYGGALGLSGIVTLFWPQLTDVTLGEVTLIGLSLCLLGTFSASIGNMMSIKIQKQDIPIVQSNAWGMLYGAMVMFVITLVQGKSFGFSFTYSYIGSLVYLSLFGSVIAFGCYLSLMTRIGSHKTSYANIMFPGVAVVISTFIEGFAWSAFTIVGLCLILIGNLIVLKPKKFLKSKQNIIKSNPDKALT